MLIVCRSWTCRDCCQWARLLEETVTGQFQHGIERNQTAEENMLSNGELVEDLDDRRDA
jgi:hypothetical protein